jgi:hypothetical protein
MSVVEILCLLLVLSGLSGGVSVSSVYSTTIIPNIVKSIDLDGPELMHSINTNIAVSGHDLGACSDANDLYSMKLYDLDTSYVDKLLDMCLPIGCYGIVSIPRKRAIAILTKAALTLPEGDIVETGCFIGTTAAIVMDILLNFDPCGKRLWLFDSFQGLPDLTKEDANTIQTDKYAVSYEAFTMNLRNIGLFDEHRLKITKGWFNETLKASPVEQISLLHLDGDIYESTWDALTAFYDKVVPGGYILVDDYGSYPGCRHAIDRFRHHKRIYEPLHYIQETIVNDTGQFPMIHFEAVYWIKRRHP